MIICEYTRKEKNYQFYTNLFQKTEKEETFYEANITLMANRQLVHYKKGKLLGNHSHEHRYKPLHKTLANQIQQYI